MICASTPQACYARDHFEREWQNVVMQPAGDSAPQRLCWVEWFAPDLLVLLEEFHDRPAQDLAPLIRRLVIEQGFVDENGDSVIDERESARLDRAVEMLVEALERTRRHCVELGRWSNVPLTPQMCG